MLLPIKWMKDYVDTGDLTSRELADKLTDTGSHVEEIRSLYSEIEKVYTGKILKIEKHPHADKLVVCKVQIKDDVLTIVTGAPNVKENTIVAVAMIGAKLPGNIRIEESDLRGVKSSGMFCSLQELGFSTSVIPKEFRDGIIIFQDDTETGRDIREVLGLDEDVIEFEITPNRPDCLSILGMARETKAAFDLKLKTHEEYKNTDSEEIFDYLDKVEIDTKNCTRYYARALKDVKIAPSPQWLQNNLMAAGVRPINNIVDLTNYVMLEYGQPLHAYDKNTIRGKEIKVYQAKEGMQFKTLDSQIRTLTSEDMVIADAEGPVGIAGIMGGMDSEITNDTEEIILEGASFNKSAIRYTSKRLNLRTEASSRFEKGLDPENASKAVNRVCELAEEIGAAVPVSGAIDIYKEKNKVKNLVLRPERANMLLGTDIAPEKMVEYLERLDIKSEYKDGKIYSTVPTFRGDISIEADLIEEIGRLYSYNKIKATYLKSDLTVGQKPYFRSIQSKVKASLKGMGYNELMTYSFMSPSEYDKMNLKKDDPKRNFIKIMNPLGEEFSVMRTTIIGNLLEVLSKNQNRNIEDMYCYEIGNTFIPVKGKVLPEEKLKLVIGFYGDEDFYYLKESIEKALNVVGITELGVKRETEDSLYHPGRCASLFAKDIYLGNFGEVHPDVMKNYEIKHKCIIGEFDFDKIIKLSNLHRTYEPLNKFPSSYRDLAIIVDENIMASEIKRICEEQSESLLEKFEIFDIYTGDQIEAGKKSVAFRMIFTSRERTLVDKEVNEIMENIKAQLQKELKAVLRS